MAISGARDAVARLACGRAGFGLSIAARRSVGMMENKMETTITIVHWVNTGEWKRKRLFFFALDPKGNLTKKNQRILFKL